MELSKVIELADNLCPNPYTLEEKIRWCDEVSAGIRRDIKKIYDVIHTTLSSSGELVLPDDIAFEDIEVAYIDGQPLDKLDFRSFIRDYDPGQFSAPRKLELVYLTRPQPTRVISITDYFSVGESFIQMDDPPFCPGDLIEWVLLSNKAEQPDWSAASRAFVIDHVYNGLMLDGDSLLPQTDSLLAIRRVLDDCTETEELPYESMYVEYLLAKMALYQRDYTAYNAHMTQYNMLYDEMRKDYKTRSTLNPVSGFHNYWNF